MTMTVKEDAVKRLRDSLPDIILAESIAKITSLDSEVKLAVICKNKDGTNTVICSFSFDEFISDLRESLGVSKDLHEIFTENG